VERETGVWAVEEERRCAVWGVEEERYGAVLSGAVRCGGDGDGWWVVEEERRCAVWVVEEELSGAVLCCAVGLVVGCFGRVSSRAVADWTPVVLLLAGYPERRIEFVDVEILGEYWTPGSVLCC
jgi:hypothetical protein